MAWGRTKTDHSGPKRGMGHWGRKAIAKATSKRWRRREDSLACEQADEAGDDGFVSEAARRTLERSEW